MNHETLAAVNGLLKMTGCPLPVLIDHDDAWKATACLTMKNEILLSRALVVQLPAHEVRAVVAHEMGHYYLKHRRRNMLYTALVTLLAGLALYYTVKFDLVPFLTYVGLTWVAVCLNGLLKEFQEREADEYAARLTSANAMGMALHRMAAVNNWRPHMSRINCLFRE